MAMIRLTGKHAVGVHAFAIVDDDMFAVLSQWAWKAKPNGSGTHVYAVRNQTIGGRTVTVRMHRVILGMGRDDPLDVDHWNHNSLDNRRSNLRRATRSENNTNVQRVVQATQCALCGAHLTREVPANVGAARASCATCKRAQRTAQQARRRARLKAKGAGIPQNGAML